MDTNSPLKTTNNEEVGAYQADTIDLNPYDIQEECEVDGLGHASLEEMRVSLHEGYVSPPRTSCEANEDETKYKLESTLAESSLPVVELEKVERARFDYGTKSVRRAIEDYEEHEHSGDDVTTTKVGIEDSIHYHRSSSDHGDDVHYDSTDREYYDKPNAKSSTPDEKTNHACNQVFVDHQTDAHGLNEGVDDENCRISYDENQMGVGGYSSEMAEPKKVQMVWENSSPQSPQETQNASLSPERRLSISAEPSLHTQAPPEGHTPTQQEIYSPVKFDLKSTTSPLSSKRRPSSSPQKEDSSRDPSSPFKRTKSPIERESKRESHHRIYSPRRNLSRSPQKNDSPRKHDSSRRRGRSRSKSPTRRRGSPGRQKDRRYSRSRSPIARNHNIRSPRRQSPRLRSPPNYHSRQRPPRRPLAPPNNRKSGIGRPGKNLFIAGFSYVTTERDLEKKFSKFGRVTDVRVVRDRSSGDSRGFGFLSLERDEDADAAIRAVDQTEWNGRILLVEKSKSSTR
ncbi:hypothetical protein KSP40_PGU004574 [Platanthera guangdongensis]|uniref:RRM domain-containing protein n=1 Tax=Platanthera guangdongensis TaxID=2320717 RepID=A0ABR2M9Y5_9ASPA